VTVRPLPSYVDQNFRLSDPTGAEYVLKIMNSEEDTAFLDAQVLALELLQKSPGRLETPAVVTGSAGRFVTREGLHPVWLVTWLSGRLMADVKDPPDALLHDLGRGLGDLDRRLAEFDDPATRRIYPWDLRNAPGALSFVDHIADPAGREFVRSRLSHFETRVLPEVDELPFQVIHNDANNHNLLVAGESEDLRVTGLLDFGDLVWTARACELAIAMAYPMLSAADPLAAGARVLAGYHGELPLDRSEIRALPHLIEARLCVSVTMSAHRLHVDPANAYLAVSEAPAWSLLDWMSDTPPDRWIDTFEDACASMGPAGGNASRERARDEA
jgi:Ser/Thr protein kinase RdoA (MazF antagonist)